MNPDQKIERQLEDWLEGEARPMPGDVLENALEAVSRTSQVGGRPRIAYWLRNRSLALPAVAVVVVVLVTTAGALVAGEIRNLANILGSGPSATESPASATESPASATESPTPPPGRMTWDLMLTFRELNPTLDGYGHEDVFSYLRGTGTDAPSTYVLLPAYEAGRLSRWHDPVIPGLYVACCDGESRLQLHPAGAGAEGVAAIMAWRNPVGPVPLVIRGNVEVQASCGDGIIFSVRHGTEALQRIQLREGTESFSIPVDRFDRGEVLYFVVEPGADSDCDTTWLTAVIESH